MKITIWGTGYVGLVTGACLADLGNTVMCIDINADKINLLNAGGVPIYEPGLDEVIKRNRDANRILFSTDSAAGVAHGEILFIAVGTPPQDDGSADLSQVRAAAQAIGRQIDGFKVIVNKSTVPVGTADMVSQVVQTEINKRAMLPAEASFSVVSNPEFLKEGAAIEDFMRPDRIVLGHASDENGLKARQVMKTLYAPFNRNHERTFYMDVRSSELTKYAANAMLATRISFMNELSGVAEKVGADIEHVRQGMGSDPRIGYSFLYAGAGYGGACFPKDVQALMHTATAHHVQIPLLNAVEEVNARQKQVLAAKVVQHLGTDLSDKTIAVWGLAFKPNTDDMRGAPSRTLLAELTQRGARIQTYDPVAMPQAKEALKEDLPALHFDRITFTEDPMSAVQGCDALVIVTEWKVFKSPDFAAIKKSLKQAIIVDGRNMFDPLYMSELGFEYTGIGRQTH